MMGKADREEIDAFETWYWRRVMRVSWIERKTNVRVRENIKSLMLICVPISLVDSFTLGLYTH